jgi:hypothetical protein
MRCRRAGQRVAVDPSGLAASSLGGPLFGAARLSPRRTLGPRQPAGDRRLWSGPRPKGRSRGQRPPTLALQSGHPAAERSARPASEWGRPTSRCCELVTDSCGAISASTSSPSADSSSSRCATTRCGVVWQGNDRSRVARRIAAVSGLSRRAPSEGADGRQWPAWNHQGLMSPGSAGFVTVWGLWRRRGRAAKVLG